MLVGEMRKLFCALLCVMLLWGLCGSNLLLEANAIQETITSSTAKKREIKFAFVFDGPSDKNASVLEEFKKSIYKSVEKDYVAVFPANLVYTADWSETGVKNASDKALVSDAVTIVSLGSLSSKYFSETKNKQKFVVTIDQYGIRELGPDLFNPVEQAIEKLDLFKRVSPYNKVAILINETYYKTNKDWHSFLKPKLEPREINYVVVPVNGDINMVLKKIPSDVDAVFITPIYNLSSEERKELFSRFNSRRIPTFSSAGRDDVELGVLLGSSALELDRKLAEAASFNIQGYLYGEKPKAEKLHFCEENVIFINIDTAETIGYEPHLRLLNNAEIISSKEVPTFNLSSVFNTLDNQNIDIERKKLLIKAAKKASLAAKLKYLPSFGVTLGYQRYNEKFAESAKLSVPEHTGIFQMGIEQIIYSPALVTNILIKRKQVNFQEAEHFLTEQNMGLEVALLYIETLIMENVINNQKEYVKETRDNLAISRVRERMGFCGKEEVLRWATQLRVSEQHLLEMNAEFNNLKLAISKLLHVPQNEDYKLAELKASDPAFYTSELHVIDYVRTPNALEAFTKLLIAEAYDTAPELSKLKAAIKMKDYEKKMYYQKFVLPDAKISLDYTSQFDREFTSPVTLPVQDMREPAGTPFTLPSSNPTNGRLGVYAVWRPIEGGSKIAEIQRIKTESEELNRYMDEVKTSLEEHIRHTINKALSAYFSIDKNYKAMFAAKENYLDVKAKYHNGKVEITQLIDAQDTYFASKLMAENSQYVFFKELVWVQRAICSVNWTKATQRSRDWIDKIKTELVEMHDITL